MSSIDFTVFAGADFNPSEYANAILAGEPYPAAIDPKSQSAGLGKEPPAKEDISEAISKLVHGIDDVTKQIKQLALQHHEDLLSQAANSNELSGSLTSVRASITELDKSLEKLRSKVHDPYRSLQLHVTRLRYLQQASDILRRTSRFIILARRLRVQMNELNQYFGPDVSRSESKLSAMNREVREEVDRVLAKGALSLAELLTCLDEPLVQVKASSLASSGDDFSDVGFKPNKDTLRAVNLVGHYMPLVEASQTRITQIMELMLYTGLASRDSAMLASSLQIAYNLKSLPELMHNLISDLIQRMEDHVRTAFDMSKLSKDALAKEAASTSQPSSAYKSRTRTEPTNITAPQWTTMLWDRLETLLDELTDCCIKVYTLEKVLTLKRDVITQALFLDEAMKSLENKPSSMFWSALARSLEKNIRDSIKGSTFMQQTLSTSYPKLLRLFHAFFAQIAPHTDTTYTQSHQSPETVLILNALSTLETHYITKSTMKMNEVVSQAFAGGARAPPSAPEGLNIARAIANELDAGKFDPLLVRSLSKNVLVVKSIISRAETLITRDRSAFSLIGPTATPQQVVNAQITTCIYQCWSRLEQLKEEHSDVVFAMLRPGIQGLRKTYESLVEPMNTSIRREISAIISKIHRVDLGKPNSEIGGPSYYIRDLTEKLSFIRTEILNRYGLGEAGREWAVSIVKFAVKTFLLHASIAKPLSESGKLQLTNDMTELEFVLSAFLVEGSQVRRNEGLGLIGDDYLALRAMRPLLFLNNEQLTSTVFTNGLRPLLVLHHILVRSPMPLPHALHGWQEIGICSMEEALTLVASGLEHWEKMSESEGRAGDEAREYADLARKVLKEAHAI
ncbi:Golgi transport complex subunit 5-domain-containing protein [Amanita rubescens]|nr:Golgi transport complex subunit 5-domain-containing protein [Amanita rubescens]